MNYVDVCTGIDAASVAWAELNWRCSAVAEIEPFPCAVLSHRFGATRPQFMPQPDDGDSVEEKAKKLAAIRAVAKLPMAGKIPNRGDFTTITGDEYGTVDLLVGGTPCQDFSVAGLRAGMDGKRGQLTVEFAHLAHRLVAKARTRWLLWENVPGVLSIDGGEAFATFLSILAKRFVRVPVGGWSNSGFIIGDEGSFGLAYRILDAQHFGVPQRRRRVFVVGYLGDWRRAAAVLFERHSLSGDTAPRREKGQSAPTIPSRSSGGGGLGTDFDCDGGLVLRREWPASVTPTLDTHYGDKMGLEDQHIRGGQVYSSTGSVPHCLNAGAMGRQDFETETLLAVGGFFDDIVAEPVTARPYADRGVDANLVTHALRGEGFDASEDGTGRGTPLVAVAHCDVLPTMRNGADTPAGHSERSGDTKDEYIVPVAIQNSTRGDAQNGLGISDEDVMYTLDQGSQHAVAFAETLQYNGFHASTQEAYATETLRVLRNEVGAEAFAQWGLGILDSLQSSQVLRSEVHGPSIRRKTIEFGGLVNDSLPCSKIGEAGTVQEVWGAEGEGCSSQRSRSHEQRSVELGAYMSLLSQQGAPQGRALRYLWIASEGIGVLREALSALQKAWRSTCGENTSSSDVQGMRGTCSQQEFVREALHAMEAGTAWTACKNTERGSAGSMGKTSMQVRRLTPTECERLMGLPDDFTKINEKTADGPRYKSLGNSMAVVVMRWLGVRIQMVEDMTEVQP